MILDQVLDDTEVAGLKGEEKIELIEKIQAGVRGRIARKTYGNEKSKVALKDVVVNVKSRVDDYSNQDVLEIVEKLGTFEYDDSVLQNDGVTREYRTLTLLDNKTRYEG